MPGEDQERFEDYLELEHYIEELQAGHVAHPPGDVTPEKANIYRMAALFRSASPEATEPRPEFAAELQARLEQELAQVQQPAQQHYRFPFLHRKSKPDRRTGVSRRALLAGGAAAAASLVIGAGVGVGVEGALEAKQVANNQWNPPLVPKDIPTTWHFVTTLPALGRNAVPFTANGIVGYVIFDDGSNTSDASSTDTNTASVDPDKGKVIAMSAACTHMGCIVQWQSSDRKYHCPCHGGLFTEYGKPDKGAGSLVQYLTSLPRLDTMVDQDGKIFVKVPLQNGSPTKSPAEETTWQG